MRRWHLIVGVLVLLVLAGGAFVLQQRKSHPGRSAAAGLLRVAEVRAPEGVRIRVQVLNATKTRGLARRATMLLRDRGFDVVENGTLPQQRDTTLILDLSGHPDWANRLAQIFAPAKVTARADSSRYLDIAVVIGSTWRPPAQPFYP
jgi:LytR cell envelope-related transcriptional attenuator